MKHLYRTAVVIFAAVALAAALLTGCGDTGPTSKDAEDYVKAVLDLMCTGEYDHSITFADIEAGKEQESRDTMIDELVNNISKENGLNEEQTAQYRDFIDRAFATCRYSIKGSEQTDDGGYDVTVSIEPLKIFNGIDDALTEEMAALAADQEKAISMTQEEQAAVLSEALFRHLDENLENPEYGPVEEIVVHYGILDESDGMYGIDEQSGEMLGEKLFSSEGI